MLRPVIIAIICSFLGLATLGAQVAPCDLSTNCCELRYPNNQDSLCSCFLETGQSLRLAEEYSEAIKYLRVVDLLCEDELATLIIDSIYNEHRIWVREDGNGEKFAIANPLGELIEDNQGYNPYRFYNPRSFKGAYAICENSSGELLLVNRAGEILNDPNGNSLIIPGAENTWVLLEKDKSFAILKDGAILYEGLSLDLLPLNLMEEGFFWDQSWLKTIAKLIPYPAIRRITDQSFLFASKKDDYGFYSSRENLFGLTNEHGDTLLPPNNKEIRWQDKENIFSFTQEDHKGLADINGQILYKTQNQDAYYSGSGTFELEFDSEAYWVDTSGQRIAKIEDFEDYEDFTEELTFFANRKGKYGLINTQGDIVLMPTYSDISNFQDGVATFESKRKMGVLNKQGKEIIGPKYDAIEDFYMGVACVMLNKKYGLINKADVTLTPIKYDSTITFQNETAIVKEGNLYGLIDLSGRSILPSRFREVKSIGSRFFRVRTESGKYQLYNDKGILLLAIGFDAFDPITNFLYKFKIGEQEGLLDLINMHYTPLNQAAYIMPFTDSLQLLVNEESFGLADLQDIEALPIAYSVIDSFYYGFARVADKEYSQITKGNTTSNFKKQGFIDRQGQFKVPLNYQRVSSFKYGTALLESDGSTSLIDTNLNVIRMIEGASVYQLPNGCYQINKKGKEGEAWKYGIWDPSGKTLFDVVYDKIELRDGLFLLDRDAKKGVGDLNGNFLIEPEYDRLDLNPFSKIFYAEKNGLKGTFDLQGNELIPVEYQQFIYGYKNKIKVSKNKKYGFYTTTGELLFEPIFEDIQFNRAQHYLIKWKGKYGLLDSLANPILDTIYEDIRLLNYGIYKVKKDGLYGFIDLKGDRDLAIAYKELKETHGGIYIINQDDTLGIYDLKQGLLLAPAYDEIKYNGENNFKVKKGGNYGLWNPEKGRIIPEKYESLDYHWGTRNYYLAKEGDNTIVYDKEGTELLSSSNSRLDFFEDHKIKAAVDSLYMLYDSLGNPLLERPCQYIFEFDGAYVFKDHSYGMMTEDGRIIKQRFERIETYGAINKTAVFYTRDSCGLINTRGEILTPQLYEFCRSISDHLFLVGRGSDYGIINNQGHIVSPLANRNYLDFRSDSFLIATNGTGYGLLNKKGDFIVAPIYSELYWPKDGLAKVQIGEKYGFVNLKGDTIIPIAFEQASSFQEGFTLVFNGEKYGFLNTKGDTIAPFIYDYAESFNKGLAKVSLRKEYRDLYGYIDTTGKVIIPIQYEYLRSFNKERAIFGDYLSYGVLDIHTDTIFPLQANFIDNYYDEIAKVTLDSGFNYLNRAGQFLFEKPIEEEIRFRDGLWKVRQGTKWTLLNSQGQKLIPFKAANIETTSTYSPIVALTTQEGISYGLLTRNNKLSLQPEYDSIYLSDRIVALKKQNKWSYGLIDYDSKIILDPIYDSLLLERSNVQGQRGILKVLKDGQWKYGFVANDDELFLAPIYDSLSKQNRILSARKGAITRYALLDYVLSNSPLTTLQYDSLEVDRLIVRAEKANQVQYGLLASGGEKEWALTLDFDLIEDFSSGLYKVCKDSLCGLYDRQGNAVLAMEYESIRTNWASKGRMINATKNGGSVFGIYDTEQGFILPMEYEYIRSINNNLYEVKKLESGKIGWLRQDSLKFVLLPEYDEIFRERTARWKSNLELYQVKKGDLFGIVDENGAPYLKGKYRYLNWHSDDLIMAEGEKGLGVIDAQENILLDLKYEEVSIRFDKYIEFGNGEKKGLANSQGRIIIPMYLDKIWESPQRLIFLYAENKIGLFFTDTDEYILPIYDKIIRTSDDLFLAKRDGKWGWIQKNGAVVIPFVYDLATPFNSKGIAWVGQKGIYYQINKKGEMLFDRMNYPSKPASSYKKWIQARFSN